MIWNKKPIDSQAVRNLVGKFSLDSLSASILVRRQITEPSEICYFLEEDVRYLHNAFLFKDMDIVVDRLHAAMEESEKVMVFGDRDVDGMTSTVLIIEALRDMDLEPEWKVPAQGETYGLSIKAVEDFAAAEGTLIITVDNGITSFNEIDRANELGIDVMVFDHHEIRGKIPDALAVINPKRPDSTYPFRELAGCGVVSKVLWALALSGSDYYNQSMVFLATHRDQEELVIDMVKMINLRTTVRLTVKSGQGENGLASMVDFLRGEPIFVFSEPEEKRNLALFLGPNVDIHLVDLQQEINRHFPALKGKDLEALRLKSRMALYEMDGGTLADVLASLFVSLFLRKENSRFQVWANSLDLVALGTVADMMPLMNENRIIVKRGMDLINRTMRKSLREILLRRKLLDKVIKADDLSWYVAPWLNSAGRMDRADLGVEFLLSHDDRAIYDLANRIDELYRKRRDIGDNLWTELHEEAEKSKEMCHDKMILLISPRIPRGITGILAARYSQYYNVPAMIISQGEESSSGSVRTMEGAAITPILKPLEGHFDDWGGHEFAAGFSLPTQGLESFKNELVENLKTYVLQAHEEEIVIDAELPGAYLNEELETLVNRMEPFGEAFPSLIFQANQLEIENLELVGKEGLHLKFLLDTGEKKWPALYWNSVEKYKKDFDRHDKVDILFKLEKNYFKSRQTLQLNIQDMKRNNDS